MDAHSDHTRTQLSRHDGQLLLRLRIVDQQQLGWQPRAELAMSPQNIFERQRRDFRRLAAVDHSLHFYVSARLEL